MRRKQQQKHTKTRQEFLNLRKWGKKIIYEIVLLFYDQKL